MLLHLYLIVCAIDVITATSPQLYSNHFVIKVQGGYEEAKNIAKTHELRLLPTELQDYNFHFMEMRSPKLSRTPAWRKTRSLKCSPKVHWVEQQVLKHRTRRSDKENKQKIWNVNNVNWKGQNSVTYIQESPFLNEVSLPNFNDPFYPFMWYLHGRGKWRGSSRPHHLNVENAWHQGVSGRGITLFILDDGLQASNHDIAPNYEAWGGLDLSDINRPLPSPTPRSSNDSHGTYCAAIVAAAANNQFCGLGIAYHAKVGGVRLLGEGPVSDLQESLALTLWLKSGHIASASWGPRDDGKTVDGPGPMGRVALLRGINMGRNGKGAIYVWAVGNGGMRGDNCNLDGYCSSIYTVTVSASKHTGKSCEYSEPCASILATTPVGGPKGKLGSSVVVPELDGSCRKNFQGTSASAPLAAGIIALLLQANPDLTWRDVQHLIVTTSQRSRGRGWHKNGAGLKFHLKQGFGMINAGNLVASGRNFVSLPRGKSVNFIMSAGKKMVYPRSNTTVSLHLPSSMLPINKLEHVEVTLTLHHMKRGQLEMFIISPARTESQVLTQRPLDISPLGFKSWPFMSVHFWSEKPAGMWTFVISNHSEEPGILDMMHITLHGHKSRDKEIKFY